MSAEIGGRTLRAGARMKKIPIEAAAAGNATARALNFRSLPADVFWNSMRCLKQ
jgi:hypothetical protein